MAAPLSDEIRSRIADRLQAGDRPCDVARAEGVSDAAVQRIARAIGVAARPGPRTGSRRESTDRQRAEAIGHKIAGRSFREIARIMGVTEGSVRYWLTDEKSKKGA